MIFGIRDTWTYERLVRPTVEWYAVAVCYLWAFMLCLTPGMGMVPSLAYTSALLFFLVGIAYHREAYRHWRFIQGLWRLEPYKIDPKNLPGGHDGIYLGQAFEWKPKHTQRYIELVNDPDIAYREPPRAFYAVRKLSRTFRVCSRGVIVGALFRWCADQLDRPSLWNPFPDVPVDLLDARNTYGSPYLHGVEISKSDLILPLADANSHTLVLGTTRQGKTRSAEIMISQDIHRPYSATNPVSVIALDPKGDIELAARMFVESYRAGKGHKFYFFHLGFPHLSCRYNGIADYNRDTEVASRVTNPLPSSGNSQVFRDFAWQFINIAQKGCSRMGRTMTYKVVAQYLKDPERLSMDYIQNVIASDDFEYLIDEIAGAIDPKTLAPSERAKNPKVIALQRILQEPPEMLREIIENDDVLSDLSEALKHERGYYDKITASAKPHLEKLNTGPQSEIISPDYSDLEDPRPIIDLRQIISDGCVLYAGFDFQSDPITGAAVANTMLTEILSVSGELYNFGVDNGMPIPPGGKRRKPMLRLHVDEANEIFGPEFNPILNKAGGSGISVVAYTQTVSDPAVRLQSADLANQMLGNFGTIISFKVRGNDTSTYLSELTPMTKVLTSGPDSGAQDGRTEEGSFSSSNRDTVSQEETRLIPETAFRELPKGEAFIYAQSRWYKTRMPLFFEEDDIPRDVEHMMRMLETARGYSATKERESIH